MNRFAILILFCSSMTFAQETKPRLRPGIQVASVFSEKWYYGISPALTLSYDRYQFSIGPRFSYDRFGKKSSFYKINTELVLDAAFRYYLLPETKRVRPFAQALASYKYNHIAFEQDYRGDMMPPYGQIYDYDFIGSWDSQNHTFSIYGGFGVDVRIWKQLSVFASAGAGTFLSRGKSELTNVETGAVENFYRSKSKGQFSWIASAGLGYRF